MSQNSQVYQQTTIDLFHQPHNAPAPNPTKYRSETEMCTYGYISVTKWCIVGYLSNALWDLWDGSIAILFSVAEMTKKSPKWCRGPNASNPARGRTLPGQERPSNGRPDASQRRPGSMLCPVGLPGALSVDILALLLYWPTYAPITVRLTSDT